MQTTGGATANMPAWVALALGVLSLPAALTAIGGMVLGLAGVLTGFWGVAQAEHLDGVGQGRAVAGIVTGAFGMAFGFAVPMVLR